MIQMMSENSLFIGDEDKRYDVPKDEEVKYRNKEETQIFIKLLDALI